MALASLQVRRACSCTRYASSTHYVNVLSTPMDHVDHLAIHHSGTEIHKRSHPSRQSHFLAKNNSQPSFHLKRENVLGLKTKINEHAASKKNLASLTKMIGYLNIELPKQISLDYQKFLPASVRRKRSKQVHVENEVEDDTTSLKEEPVQKATATAVDVPNKDPRDGICDEERKRLIAKLKLRGHNIVDREQHDFEQAMSNTYESLTLSNPPTPGGKAPVKQTKSSTSTAKTQKPESAKDASKTMADNIRLNTSSLASSTGDLVKSITNMLPSRGTTKSQSVLQKEEAQQVKILRRENLARGSADRKTKGLVLALRASTSNISRLRRLEEFCKHMADYPSTRGKAVKDKAVPCLLKLRGSRDQAIRELSMEALALVGYVEPVKARGIRVLCLDGGGTRGLITIAILKQLQEYCGKELHTLFDYICGVSTGSLISVMLGAYRVPLLETELLYKEYSTKMFSRNKLMGVGKLFMSHAYYDAGLWENILQESIGFKSFLESTRDPQCPKLCVVSSLMNVPHLQNYLFRNYNLPPGVQSHYLGSFRYQLWEAIRASSAAPGYFEERKLGEWVHQDGGLITNNPTAIALHECRLLWPSDPIQCVVSVGTGKYEPGLEAEPVDSASLKNKLTKIVQSATDTEAVHTTLHDLLPPSSYFRFNPNMSEDFELDEIRKDKWDQMAYDTEMYCRKNEMKLRKAAATLLKPKMPHQKAADWLKNRRDMVG